MFAIILDHDSGFLAALHLSFDDSFCKTIANLSLYEAIERASAISGIISFVAEPCLHILANVQCDASVVQTTL